MLVAMPMTSASAEQRRARGDLVGALRHAVHVADQRADRRRDAAGDQQAEHEPAERSDEPGDGALARNSHRI